MNPITLALLQWFQANMRPLPWRREYKPYEIWISEVMLQQTQMDRGVEYFTRWMRLFPTLRHVAEAPPEDLIKAFEGLGYYSRVRSLREAARIILRDYKGELPADPNLLRGLPGIGEYTAGAIASIAFNQPCVAVDANVERVFARLFDIPVPVKNPQAAEYIREKARELMPVDTPRLFNQALMDLGAVLCAKKPRCPLCPLAPHCRAQKLGLVLDRPVPGKKTVYTALETAVGILEHQGRIFLRKRPDTGLWAGFWEFPDITLEGGKNAEESLASALCREFSVPVTVTRPLCRTRHGYTRYKTVLHGFLCAFSATPLADSQGMPRPAAAAAAYRWELPDTVASLALAGGHKKIWDACLQSTKNQAMHTLDRALKR